MGFFANSSQSQNPSTNLPDIIKKVDKSVFIIHTFNNNNEPLSQGSGFFINENGIGITNFHVLQGANSATIKTISGNTSTIKLVIDYDEKIDIVKFQIDNQNGKKTPYLAIAQKKPKIGESIFNISNPLGLEQTVSNGIVSAYREIPPYGNLIQITAPISEGSSGSPILNNSGEVIGIATLGSKRGQNLNFAVPYSEINMLKRTLNVKINELGTNRFSTTIYKNAENEYLNGNLAAGLKYLNEELEKNPTNHLALNLKGRILTDLGDYIKAIECLYYAVNLDSTAKDYQNNFGIANAKYGYSVNGDYDSFITAMVAYSKAIDIDPTYTLAYLNRAFSIYNNTYRLDEPIIDPNNIYKAITDLNTAISIDPDYASAYSLRATIKYKLKDNWAALADIDNAILINKDNYEFFFTRGEIKSFGINDYGSAISDFDIALTLTNIPKQQADILGLRSITNMMLGNKIDACYDAKKAYQLEKSKTYSELISKVCN